MKEWEEDLDGMEILEKLILGNYSKYVFSKIENVIQEYFTENEQNLIR